MALCARCGATVPDDAAHCVQCGLSMVAPPDPAAAPKRTMMGLVGVDQNELQRAIAAARAATAAGETPKKAARRTMMGVAAVKAPAVAKPAPGAVDGNWGAPDAAVPKDEALDEGWDLSESPAGDFAASPAAAAPPPPPRPAAPAEVRAAPRSAAPTAPSTPSAKVTAMLESMAALPVGSAPAPAVPTPADRPPERTTDPGMAASPPVQAASAGAAPVSPSAPSGARMTVAMSSMAPPSVKPVGAAAPPAGGPRATAVLGAMALPPTTPATKPVSVAPTSPARSAAAPAQPPVATPAVPRAAPRPELKLADTLQGDASVRDALAASRALDAEMTPPPEIAPIAASSPDPLADTISPGSMRIDEILRGMESASSAAVAAAPPPTATPPAPASAAPGAPAPSTPTGPLATVPPTSATTPTSTGIRRAATGTTHPPFLASKALAEDMHPTEPGRGEMRAIAIAGCVALAALWAAPLSLSPLTFAWSSATALSGAARLLAYYAPIAAVVLLALGVAKVPYRARAVGALAVGLIPLILGVGGLGPAPTARGWPGAVLTIAMVVLPGALIHRANYRGSNLARALVALGMLLVLAWMFVPGGANLLSTVLTGLGTARGLPQSVVMVGALGLVAASLLGFMPSSTTAGTAITGRLLLLVRPALLVAAAVADGTAARTPVALGVSAGMLLVFGVLSSFGMAQALASLERRAV